MPTTPKWGGRKPAEPTHTEPPPPNPLPALIAADILRVSESDPLKFLCLTSCEPRVTAVANLPGTSPEDKAEYVVAYLEAGYAKGLTAWDLIQGAHDPDLVRATPVNVVDRSDRSKNVRIKDPVAAVAFLYPEPWYDSSNYRLLEQNLGNDPKLADAKLDAYRKRAAG